MEKLPLIARAHDRVDSIAFRAGDEAVSYARLLEESASLAGQMLDGRSDLEEGRVAFLAAPGLSYAATQWGVWRAGGVAVPLCASAAEAEWEYALKDSQAELLVVGPAWCDRVRPLAERLGIRLLELAGGQEALADVSLPDIRRERRAMILYTSGTTSRPKGVVSTHRMIQAQIEALVEAWKWSDSDSIPLFLPLHHVHGIINVLSCALWAGATIEPFPRFDLKRILARVEAGAYSLFMAVPTIYVKMIQALEAMSANERDKVIGGFQTMRLMISGSAALPASIHARWEELTGQRLLERYGMTEIGMAISNPYRGERRPGFVGLPLPGTEVRLVTESGRVVCEESEPGEIQVRGDAVFAEYWQRPDITRDSFVDAWFRTGDIAVREDGYYRIMGRRSVDIIKSGGYKLSALEIEAILLDHPAIRECAVVGVPDETWGEAVAAAVVLESGETLELADLRIWCQDRMSAYKRPHRLLCVDSLPRNAMGKVTKPQVMELV